MEAQKRNRNTFVIFVGSLKKGGVERFAAILANHLVSRDERVILLTFTDEVAFDLDGRVEKQIIDYRKFPIRFLNVIYVYFRLLGKVWSIRPKRLITLSRIAGLYASLTFFPKTIVMFDIYPLTGYRTYKKYQFLFCYNLPWVKYVVSCSQELKDDVIKYALNKNKIPVIPYPVPKVDPSMYVNVEKLHPRPYFVVVARLNAQKNVDKVIDTFVKQRFAERMDLLVLGDGPEMERISQQVRDLNAAASVHLKGFVRNPYAYIVQAYCLINASMREGFPNVLIESLSLGTPVISSLAKTGPREIITDGLNGLQFSVGDYQTLGKLMARVTSDDAFYRHLKTNTNAGLDRYTMSKVMGAWDEILGIKAGNQANPSGV